MTRTITVAALQLPLPGPTRPNIEAVSALVEEAAAKGAQIILPPELFEGPYFCQVEEEELFATARPTADHPSVVAMQALGRGASQDIASVFDAAYAFCAELGIEMTLSGLGVPQSDLDAMADDAFAIRRLLDNNPRDLSRADIRSIYEAAF